MTNPSSSSSAAAAAAAAAQHQLQELAVAKSELTHGDTSGLVYVQSSMGAAFLVTPRRDALRIVEEKIASLNKKGDR